MGDIVTFSGFDGVGKTTQCNILKDYFVNEHSLSAIDTNRLCNNFYTKENDLDGICSILEDYDVIVTRLNLSSTKTNELKKRLFYEVEFEDIYNPIIGDLFNDILDNIHKYYNKVIKPLLDLNKIIIFDRYIYDEVAYRPLYGIDRKKIQDLLSFYPEGNIRFLLKTELETVLERNLEREDSKTKLYQNIDKLEELADNFDFVSRAYNLVEINATQVDMSKEIIKHIEKNISNKNTRSLNLTIEGA
jgi:thymidylate kinase